VQRMETCLSGKQCGRDGLIGSGSMSPEVLEQHIRKCKEATDQPFGVNVPLLYPHREAIFDILIREKIKIIFTSAGNPPMDFIPERTGMTVVHVVANVKSAKNVRKRVRMPLLQKDLRQAS